MATFNAPVGGLYTSPNPFSQAPAGSLARADNVRFTAPGVLAPRPGYPALGNATFGSASSRATSIGFFGASTLIHYDDSKVSVKASLAAAFVDLTGVFARVAARMRFVGAARDIFWNASDGVWMWDGVGQARRAGNPQGLSLSGYPDSTAGWMDSDTAVAYRYTICSLDAFGRVIEGAPSGRFIIRNLIETQVGQLNRAANVVTASTGLPVPSLLSIGDVVTMSPAEANFPAGAKTVTGTLFGFGFTYAEVGANATSTVVHTFTITRSVQVNIDFKATVTTANFIRLYRSEMTAHATDSPSDEMWQVYETAFLTAGQVAAGYITVHDTTPESVLEVPLYTNANTGQGALQANYQPPIAGDMAYFANRMWLANTTNKHRLELALIGIGAPDGLQDGDTITVAGTTYRAKNVPALSLDFKLDTNFDVPTNIRVTALNLVSAINSAAQTDVYAYYASAENGLPGRILIEARGLGAAAFIAKASRGASWNPQLPVTTEFVVSSDNNRHAAGLFYSKLGLPEAVPPGNYLPVDADNDAILRVCPLNHQLIIFKTNGVYICNDTAPFSIQKISQCHLIAPDSVSLLGSALYALTDQGVVRVTDSGVEPISIPIDDSITPLFGAVLANLRERSVGFGYESARQYLCWMPEGAGVADYATGAFVFSTLSGGFTRYLFGARAVGLNPNTDQLYVAPTDANYLLAENESYTDDDYADRAYSVNVTNRVGAVLTLASVALCTVGDVLIDSAGTPWVVTEVDATASTVTTFGRGSFPPGESLGGAAYVGRQAIACDVRFNKLTGGQPATVKNWQQVSLLTRRNTLLEMDVSLETEASPSETTVELTNFAWGESAWGDVPYGNPSPQLRRIEPLPLEDSQACQLSVSIQVRQALAGFEILGLVAVSAKETEANNG